MSRRRDISVSEGPLTGAAQRALVASKISGVNLAHGRAVLRATVECCRAAGLRTNERRTHVGLHQSVIYPRTGNEVRYPSDDVVKYASSSSAGTTQARYSVEMAEPAAPSWGGALSDQGICWVGAHGGAGATTLAAVTGGLDVGCRWPDPARFEPARVILVARTHAGGIRAASRALDAMREGRHPAGMTLVGVVLVADAPGFLPRPLVRRIRVLRAAAQVWRVPWMPQWRLGKPTDRLPSQVSRLATMVEKWERPGVRAW